MKKIIGIIAKAFQWLYQYLWVLPTTRPVTVEMPRLKASEVAKEYIVVQYHGQRINMHRTEYPAWKISSRRDKRAMKEKFARQEQEGRIKFVEIEGHLICVKNKDYEAMAKQKK